MCACIAHHTCLLLVSRYAWYGDNAAQAVSRYLLGYEFNATVLVLTRTELHVLTSEKKAALLEPLVAQRGVVKIVLHA